MSQEIKDEIVNEVEAPQVKKAESAKMMLLDKNSWGDIMSSIGAALKEWWAADKDQVIAVGGTLLKSLINFIVNKFKDKQSK